MGNEQQPINIFDFATSELSQDAFLCWLFTHIEKKHANDAPEPGKVIAQKFLERMFAKYQSSLLLSMEDYELECVQRQKWNIDILLELTNTQQGRPNVSIILEDKTSSGESREQQLEHYIGKLHKHLPSNIIIPVYFKTGYISPAKKEELEQREVVVIDTHEVYDIMNQNRKLVREDAILASWWDYFYRDPYTKVRHIEQFDLSSFHHLGEIRKGKWSKEALKPIADAISNHIFDLEDSDKTTWILKRFKVQGSGQISFHTMLSKPAWSNEALNVSASINLIVKDNFQCNLAFQIKPEPYKSARQLSAQQKETFARIKAMIKQEMRSAKDLKHWKMQNHRLQSAVLIGLEDTPIDELPTFVQKNIDRLEHVVDAAFHQLQDHEMVTH